MSRLRRFESGWCETGTHHKCPHVCRTQRSVVISRPSGTTVVELGELRCACGCHRGEML